MSRLYTGKQWKVVQYFVWAESAKIMLSFPEFSAYIGKHKKSSVLNRNVEYFKTVECWYGCSHFLSNCIETKYKSTNRSKYEISPRREKRGKCRIQAKLFLKGKTWDPIKCKCAKNTFVFSRSKPNWTRDKIWTITSYDLTCLTGMRKWNDPVYLSKKTLFVFAEIPLKRHF